MYGPETIVSKPNSILTRFEPGIGSGTVFLFSAVSGVIKIGNSEAYCILHLIDGKKSLREICNHLLRDLPRANLSDVVGGVTDVVRQLVSEGFLEVARPAHKAIG